MSRRIVVFGVIAVLAIAGGWWLTARFCPARATGQPSPTSTTGTPAAADARKITATLYFVSEDGLALVGVQREVPFGETVLDQAKLIVDRPARGGARSARSRRFRQGRRCGRCT